jgi:hypothetical protein
MQNKKAKISYDSGFFVLNNFIKNGIKQNVNKRKKLHNIAKLFIKIIQYL